MARDADAKHQDVSDCEKKRRMQISGGGRGHDTRPRSESSLLIRLRAMYYVHEGEV